MGGSHAERAGRGANQLGLVGRWLRGGRADPGGLLPPTADVRRGRSPHGVLAEGRSGSEPSGVALVVRRRSRESGIDSPPSALARNTTAAPATATTASRLSGRPRASSCGSSLGRPGLCGGATSLVVSSTRSAAGCSRPPRRYRRTPRGEPLPVGGVAAMRRRGPKVAANVKSIPTIWPTVHGGRSR
jgi:hypothetical protein